MANQIDSDLTINGGLNVLGTLTANVSRGSMIAEANTIVSIPITTWRTATTTPVALGTASGTDLGVAASAVGTGSIYLTTSVASGSPSQLGRVSVSLPPEYVAGTTVYLRAYHGTVTAVPAAATCGFRAYKSAKTAVLNAGSNLVTTSAVSNTSATLVASTFTLTSTSLSPGDLLDVEITLAASAAGSGLCICTAVELLCTTRG
jgi:hypothetical protein